MPRLFGTDGVRGIVGQWPMVPEFALRLGLAAGQVLTRNVKRPAVVAGRDTRASGPMLQTALTAGFLATGVEVLDVAVMTTPGIAWTVKRLGAVAGAAISASHNPVDQNGIKFFGSGGMKLTEALEEVIEQMADPQPGDSPLSFPAPKQWGKVSDSSGMHDRYLEALLTEQPDLRLDGLTLVIDCANGAASKFAPDIFARLGAQVAAVHASPSGININVEAGSEFVRQRPEKLGSLVQSYKASFGVAFDGDADRVILVDEKGGVVDGDHILGMLARYLDGRRMLLSKTIVTTTMRNNGLKTFLEKAGLKLIETPVGDRYVAEQLAGLRNEMTPPRMIGLGGEQSGHIVLFNNDFSTGDGMRTALYVIKAYLDSGAATLSEFAAGIGKTPQVIASAEVGLGPRLDGETLANIEQQTLASTPGLTRINLRYSGTEPKFRVMLESDGTQAEEALANIAHRICKIAQSHAGARGSVEIQNCTRGGLLKPTVL